MFAHLAHNLLTHTTTRLNLLKIFDFRLLIVEWPYLRRFNPQQPKSANQKSTIINQQCSKGVNLMATKKTTGKRAATKKSKEEVVMWVRL